MTAILKSFNLNTKAYCDVINITAKVQQSINDSGINDGIVNVHNAGTF